MIFSWGTTARLAGKRQMNRPGRRWARAAQHGLVGLVLLTCSMVAAAQTVTPPPSTDPGRLRERFNLPPARPAGTDIPEFKASEGGDVPEGVKAVRVTLREIRVDGATVFTPQQLRALTDPYLNREISGSEIFALAQALTAHFRNAGYFLSVVIVPPQTLSQGSLSLRVFEGYIAEVHIEGEPSVRDKLAALGRKIQASRPLKAQDLERHLLVANDYPGMQLRSVLSPSRVLGAADLTLVASVQRFDGFASVDNYGSRYLGPNQGMLGLNVNQFFTSSDQLRYVGVGTGNTQLSYHQLAWSNMLGADGLRLGLSYSYARTQPGDFLKASDVRGRSDGVTLSLAYPVLRTRNESVFARVLYDALDIDTDTTGFHTFENRIRAVRAGLAWQALDRLDGQNELDLAISQGVGGTQADDTLKGREGADGFFTKLSFDYARVQALGARWSLLLGAAGQWTENKPLLASEQFALGGRRFGRAYEAAEIVGDRGLALRVEPRYLLTSNGPWVRSSHLLAFYDIGEVSTVGVQSATTAASQSLASAGVGTRLVLAGNVTAQIEAAWPLTRPLASAGENGKVVRLLGSLMVRF